MKTDWKFHSVFPLQGRAREKERDKESKNYKLHQFMRLVLIFSTTLLDANSPPTACSCLL